MHLAMFDIDGTLVDSMDFDKQCYLKTIRELFNIEVSKNVEDYKHATDSGILDEIITQHNISGNRAEIHRQFRHCFYTLISDHIAQHQDAIHEIKGASRFLNHLRSLENVSVAIATGGWEETAKLKLQTVNIDYRGLAFASSSDHHVRTEVMRIAEKRASNGIPFQSKTYFGDAIWDKKASAELNYRFVLIGNNVTHNLQINDYQNIDHIVETLNLH